MWQRLIFGILMGALALCAAERHEARGIVLKTDAAHDLLVISCEAIPGYMDAMEMEFLVQEPKLLFGLKQGMAVNFSIVSHGNELYAEDISEGTTTNFESEPMEAGQLTALNNMLAPAGKQLATGDRVPDFSLTDQAGATIHLTQFGGKVVVLTFGYSRCPNPDYCFRLSSNLARVEQRFHSGAGKSFVLMTIMIDPEHDQGAILSQYAGAFKADPASWHFLTGAATKIKQIAAMFGMNFWSVDGLVTHSLHTVIIDRQGRLAVNLDGNRFTPQELCDLVGTVIDSR